MMSIYSGAQRPPASLHEFLREQFPPEGKAQRVSLALEALNEEEKSKLSAEQWRWETTTLTWKT